MGKDEKKSTKDLSDIARRVTQEGATEPAFSGELLEEKGDGMYHCVVCNQELFSSDAKYESGTGWPSFYEAVREGNLTLAPDNSHGLKRTEVRCGSCDGHLGHVFNDGPEPTGKRFCINSCALSFEKEQ